MEYASGSAENLIMDFCAPNETVAWQHNLM